MEPGERLNTDLVHGRYEKSGNDPGQSSKGIVPEAITADDVLFRYLFPAGEVGADLLWNDITSDLPIFSFDEAFCYSPMHSDLGTANGLIDELTEYTLSLPKLQPEAAPNDKLTTGIALFTALGIEKLVSLYFRKWNHHSPILHKGTFNTHISTFPLLLAVILTGGLLSSVEDEWQR